MDNNIIILTFYATLDAARTLALYIYFTNLLTYCGWTTTLSRML